MKSVSPEVLAVVIFALCYIYISVFQKGRLYFLGAGVLILILAGVYNPEGAAGTFDGLKYLLRNINWGVLMILVGAMFVAELFTISGVPMMLSDLMVKHTKTAGGAALAVCALSGALSVAICNVTTVLIIAPVALQVTRKVKINPIPVLIGIAIMSNLQGAATLIGDPPSLILAAGMNMSFMDFFFIDSRPAIFFAIQVGSVFCLLALWLLWFRKYDEITPSDFPVEKPQSWVPTIILFVMIAGLVLTSMIEDYLPFNMNAQIANGLVCMLAAAVGLVWHLKRGMKETWKVVLKFDAETIVLLFLIFSLAFALDKTGFIAQIANWVGGMVGTDKLVAYILIVGFSVAISAFVDNVPYTALMVPMVVQLAEVMGGGLDVKVLLAFGLLAGACLGGNITPIGASANIVAMGILRREGQPASFGRFVSMGLPLTAAAVIPAAIFLWIVWG